jgi:hypothetical protein
MYVPQVTNPAKELAPIEGRSPPTGIMKRRKMCLAHRRHPAAYLPPPRRPASDNPSAVPKKVWAMSCTKGSAIENQGNAMGAIT